MGKEGRDSMPEAKEARRVQQRTIASRERIDAAAFALFCEKGYFNTNTKEIAKRAGTSVGNFYNYYKDKGEVYYTLLKRYVDGSYQALAELSRQMQGSKDMMGIFSQYVYTQMERAGEAGHFFLDGEVLAKDDPRLQEVTFGGTERIVREIEELLRHVEGIRRRASYPVMARTLFHMVDEMSKDIVETRGSDIYQEYLEQLILMVRLYLLGEDPAEQD